MGRSRFVVRRSDGRWLGGFPLILFRPGALILCRSDKGVNWAKVPDVGRLFQGAEKLNRGGVRVLWWLASPVNNRFGGWRIGKVVEVCNKGVFE